MTTAPLPAFGRDAGRLSQMVFRSVLDAVAHPARRTAVPNPEGIEAWPIEPAAAATLLALLDADTALYPDPSLDPNVGNSLRFHTGAQLTADPSEADFALVPAERLGSLGRFSIGTAEYPDRSTTVVVLTESLSGGVGALVSGPGIPGTRTAAPQGFGVEQWMSVAAQAAESPLGVDLLVCAGEEMIGLPRSTRIALGSEV